MIFIDVGATCVVSLLVGYFVGKRRGIKQISSGIENSVKTFLAQMGGDSHEGSQ